MRKIKVFIASPGEVAEERDVITYVVAELGRTLGTTFSVDLEAIRWETQAWPDVGDDAQDVINREIKDYDIFVGVTLHQIYFTKSLANELGELCASFHSAAFAFKEYCETRNFPTKPLDDESTPRLTWEDAEGLLSSAKIDADSALRIAEAEFRELLGVEQNIDENTKSLSVNSVV
jgi:hypothetical protein